MNDDKMNDDTMNDDNKCAVSLTFLGTGTSQGIPVIACNCRVCRSADARDRRLRASVLFDVAQGSCHARLLIDAGPDFRQQMLRAQVTRLDGILLTHEHKDHTGGLDDVRALNYTTGKPVDVYAETRVHDALKREYAYAFAEHKYPGVPEFNLCTIDEDPFTINGIEIIPVRVWHHRLPVLGFRIGRLAYITDASRIDEREKEKLQGLDILVLNVIRRTPHLSHFSLPEALALYDELQPKRLYLSHLSHQIEPHAELAAALPPNVLPAYDGLTVTGY
ncbi:MAG: MBL fold metallo-hydrolase [Prevotellaceae bacterium]|jgi:phosphoribosyl 1,2-cyclic phosphate phosphodiesterase|nr:MBL fold metallo-hydrolase [Prevotellaceae bacterium]